MTNREWLQSLTDDEFAEWLFDDSGYIWDYEKNEMKPRKWVPTFRSLCREYRSSYHGVKDWLKEEHRE